MKVNGVFQTNMIQAYNDSKKRIVKNAEVTRTDSLQISAEARNLHNISNEGTADYSASKVESLKKQISQGSYNPNPELIAQKMMAIIKGSEV